MPVVLDHRGDEATVARLSRRGRAARLWLAGLVVAGLLAGTAVGSDDDFPVGPFVMFAFRADPDGVVSSLRLEAATSAGETVPVPVPAVGMRRAELEGEVDAFRADPARLAGLVAVHDRTDPGQPWRELRLVRDDVHLRGGRPQPAVTVVLARWVTP